MFIHINITYIHIFIYQMGYLDQVPRLSARRSPLAQPQAAFAKLPICQAADRL